MKAPQEFPSTIVKRCIWIEVLPNVLEFKVWGVDILKGFPWEQFVDSATLKTLHHLMEKSDGRLSVKGFGMLKFKDVLGGYCKVWPRDPSSDNGDFLRKASGEEYSLKRVWPVNDVAEDHNRYLFFGAELAFPKDSMELELVSKGTVSFEFDTDDCMSFGEFWRKGGYIPPADLKLG